MYTLIVHIANSEPVKVDVDELPSPKDTCIIGKNPRLRTEKEVDFLDEGVNTVIFPWHRISFVQVFAGDEDESDFVGLFRD